jgi:hypothetical protein
MTTHAIDDIDQVSLKIEVVEQINIATSQFFDDDNHQAQRATKRAQRNIPLVKRSVLCAF